MTFKIEFHSIEKHIINKSNMQDYILSLPELMKKPLYLIEFHLTENELTILFSSIGFVKTADDLLTYTNNTNCTTQLNFAIVDSSCKDYYIFYEVVFTHDEYYPDGFRITYNQRGIPSKVVFSNNMILKSLRLMSINYEIDKQNLQIAKISYRFDDGRKYQKAIKGFIYTIIETPIKRVIGDVSENVSIYDVVYLRLNMREHSELFLSDIIRHCGFSSSKLIGTDYTQFLQMYKMFNKREQEIIAMAYI